MKLLYTLSILSCLVFISCGDDEPLSEQIIGSWKLKSIEPVVCPEFGTSIIEVDSDDCVTLAGDVTCDVVLTFNADGTAVERFSNSGFMGTDNYTYIVDDEASTLQICENAPLDCEMATLDGNTLIRNLEDAECTIIIEYTRS